MTSLTARPIEILLVEDSLGDARLAQEALRESKVLNNLHVVTDGEQALAFLRRTGKHVSAARPDLILMDLNLPNLDGRQVLDEVKQDGDLCSIPVVVLTTSRDEEDVLKSYQLHANCYISKPLDLDRFGDIVRSIEQFWFSIVTLPTPTATARGSAPG
jgi:CheY-like chemotaxis protein